MVPRGTHPPRAWAFAEFEAPHGALEAATRLKVEGHPQVDTHSPFPLHGAEAALLLPRSRVPLLAFLGGALGLATGYLMQWYTAAVDFPLNVGDRAPHAYPSFIPVTFELMVLGSAFAIFFGLLFLWRLPRPHHPAFELEEFRSASMHRFWVSVGADSLERAEELAQRLKGQGAIHVSVVEEEP